MRVMPLMVHGDGEEIPDSLAFICLITPMPHTTRDIFQNLPWAYIKLAREAVNSCKINRKMVEINLFQAKTNPTSVFWTEITDVNEIYYYLELGKH